jgi:HEAT repeat protein
MACSAFRTSLLIVVVVSSAVAGAEQPRILTDRQVKGVKAALEDPSTQLATLVWLTKTPCANEELVNPIATFLTHRQVEFQSVAVKALEEMGEKAVPALRDLLKDPKADDHNKRAAVEALGRMGEKVAKAIDALIDLLRDTKADNDTKRAAMKALVSIGETAEAAVPALIDLLKDTKADNDTKRAAMEALEKIEKNEEEAVPALIDLLKDSNADRPTKLAAVGALGRIGKKVIRRVRYTRSYFSLQTVSELVSIQANVLAALRDLLKDPKADDDSKRAAALALGEMGEKAAVHSLINLVNDPKANEYTKLAAAKALGEMGENAVAVPALLDLLKDPEAGYTTKRYAATALEAMGAKAAAVPALLDLLKDQRGATRRGAALALGEIGEKAAAVSTLIDLLKDRKADDDTKRYAASELEGMAAEAVPVLRDLLKDPKANNDTKRYAATALERMGEKATKAVPDLIDLLNDTKANTDTKRSVAKALETIEKKVEEPKLSHMLKQATEDSNQVAAALNRAKTVSALIDQLKDPSVERNTKLEVAKVLEERGEEAVPALIKLLKETNNGKYEFPFVATPPPPAFPAAPTGPSPLANAPNRENKNDTVQDRENKNDTVQEILIPFILRIDKKRTFQEEWFIFLSRLNERSCDEISKWLRVEVEATAPQFCWTLEAAFSRREGRDQRRLDAYLTASDADRPLIRWLGDRYEEKLPWDILDHAQSVERMKQLAQLLPAASETPSCRAEIPVRIADILRKESWTRSDLDALREVKKALEEANLDTSYVQNQIEKLELGRKALDYVRSGGYFVAAHLAFWAGLLFLYPRSRWVQAFFFWNPWVRTITGLVYVPWLITLVPVLRRRLLAPFRENLVARAFTDEFQEDSYYDGLKMTSMHEGKMVERVAAKEFTPPLTGSRVLVAPSGFGKTTLLRRFATIADRPVVVLRATECEKGVAEAIQERLLGIAADERFLQTLVYSGGLDVLIDGLNEAGPETRGLISAFVNKLFKGNYVLTTQPLLDFKVPRAAERWRLQALDAREVEAFLGHQWVRVEPLKAGTVDRGQYDAAVKEVLDEFQESLDESDELYQFGPRNPMDASLIAELIAQDVKPDPNNLIAQYVDLAHRDYRRIYPDREPRFDLIGTWALKAMRDKSTHMDLAELSEECKVLEERRLLLLRDRQWVFRHDRLRDYFIAISLDYRGAIEIRQDSRLTGVFEFLSDLLSDEDANRLGEVLRDEAAGDRNSPVWPAWLKYKQHWRIPDASSMISGFVTRATAEFQNKRPGEDPRYATVGERAFESIKNGQPIDLQGLEAERDSLLAADILRNRDGRIEFRTPRIRDYFLAMSLDKDGALTIRAEERLFNAFEFLPKFLPREDANDLGQKLKAEFTEQGEPTNSAWHHYKKHWRGRNRVGE